MFSKSEWNWHIAAFSRSTPIESEWHSDLFSLYYIEIHFSVLPFLDPRSRMINSMFWPRHCWSFQKVSESQLTLSSIESLKVLFPESIVDNDLHTLVDRIHREWNCRRKVSEIICLFEETAVFSRSMVNNVLYILAHGKKDGFAAAVDKT